MTPTMMTPTTLTTTKLPDLLRAVFNLEGRLPFWVNTLHLTRLDILNRTTYVLGTRMIEEISNVLMGDDLKTDKEGP